MAATFSWLNRTHVFPVQKTLLPYPLFVLLGTSVWQLFASGLTNSTQSLVAAGSLITKINFPRETLVLAAFGQSAFDFVVRLMLVVIAFALYHVVPPWTAVLIPFVMFPLCLLTLAFGFFFALVNGVVRDAGQIVTFALTFGMFLTPVVYPPSTHKTLLNLLNPVSPYVIATQDLVTRGYLTQPGNFAIGCLMSLMLFFLSWRVFHLSETRIAERV